ncbi:D-alanyl-D-alanine carboxypeptidase family protein [Streptomyces flavidovirens]|uniref:D-alanyl-D-alanine carboxypeptidase family protein n=1 Tax=Streptomyces flavidovirens TaxID=67298 RepID=UPI0003FFCBC1|nr:serine hydrolase [Streptomyces flavidovirens]
MITRSTVRGVLSGAVFTLVTLALPQPPAAAAVHNDPLPPPRPASVSKALLHRPGTHVRLKPGAPALPRGVSALSWLVADVGTGDVLAAHDAHRRLPPASTIKTLFALTALPRLSGRALHTVTDTELAAVGEGSSVVGVSPGHTYRTADLWRGVFLSSGNDAVHVLAKMNGGWKATAAQMQAKARALGALDTHVVSPDGYDAPGQVSSAFDLAVFGRSGLADPQFARYAATADTRFPGATRRDGSPTWTFRIRNTNRLLTGNDGVRRYPGIIGLKNGYTSRAGHTLIAAAERDGRRLLVTVMNPQRGGGHAVYEEARSLLDWGFAAVGRVHPVGSLKPPAVRQDPQTAPVPAAQAAALRRGEPGSGVAYSWLGALIGAACLTAGVIVWTRGGHSRRAYAGRFASALGPVRALARRGRPRTPRPPSRPGPP